MGKNISALFENWCVFNWREKKIYLHCLKIDVYLIDEENYICDMISAFRSATTSVIFEVINPCALKKEKQKKYWIWV